MIKCRHRYVLHLLFLLSLVVGPVSLANGREPNDKVSPVRERSASVNVKPTATAKLNPQVVPKKDSTLASALPSRRSGEQIRWQVVSSGGTKSTSANFILTGTVGQTATGPAASTSFKVNQGFWQTFIASCCVGTTGNVNMSGGVDLADLSALVAYLTGGGYVLACLPEANVNGLGAVDLADLSALVNYLTGGGYVLPLCP